MNALHESKQRNQNISKRKESPALKLRRVSAFLGVFVWPSFQDFFPIIWLGVGKATHDQDEGKVSSIGTYLKAGHRHHIIFSLLTLANCVNNDCK